MGTDLLLLQLLAFLGKEREMLDLFEELVAEYVCIILKLVLHLDEGFKVIFLEQLSLLQLISEIMVEVL